MEKISKNYIRSTRLTELLDFKRVARGVDMDVTQLDEGPFEAEIVQLKVRNVLASMITPNRRLRLRGDVRFLTFSFLSAGSGPPSWRGIPVKPGDVLAAKPGENFDFLVPPGVDAICISATTGDTEVALRYLGGPILAKKLVNTDRPIACDPTAIRSFRSWLIERFRDLGGDASIRLGPALELEREFLRRLAACIRDGAPASDRAARASKRIVAVQRVEEHLLRDLAIPRNVNELCRIAETSRRTLEYAFREYFGTSPKRFLKALRLNAARNDLLRASRKSTTVGEIASGWGFLHMSQFAVDYRRMFGEKPSATLRHSY